MFNFGRDTDIGMVSGELFRSSSLYRNAINRHFNGEFGDRAGLVSVQVDETGKPYFRIMKGDKAYRASSMSKVREILSEPLNSIQIFSGRQTAEGRLQPSLGGYHNRRLEEIAHKSGLTVEKRSYDLTGRHGFNTLFQDIKYSRERPEQALGFPVIDDNRADVLMFRNAKGEYLTVESILENLRGSLGLRFGDDLSVLAKRMKALTAPRAADMALSGVDKPFVDFFTADQYHRAFYGKTDGTLSQLELQTLGESGYRRTKGGAFAPIGPKALKKTHGEIAAKYGGSGELADAVERQISRSIDGQMFINSEYLDGYVKSLQERIATYRLRALKTVDPQEAAIIQRELNAYENTIKKIKSIQKYGGSSNERIVSNIFGKGDAIFYSPEAYKNMLLEMGMAEKDAQGKIVGKNGQRLPDVVMLKGQDKKEIALDEMFMGTSEFRNKAKQLEIGVTESATFPMVFNEKFLESSFQEETRNILREFRDGRSKTGSLANMVDEVMNSPLPDFASAAEAAEYQQMRKYARKIQSSFRYGVAPAEIDNLGIQFISMYKNHFLKFRKNGKYISGPERLPDMAFRTRVKGGSMGEVSDMAALFSPLKKQTPFELMQGTIRYDKAAGRFGLNAGDFYRAYKAHGGFDADDTIRPVLHYDPKTKRALAFVGRQPFESGEFMFYDADITTMPMFGIDDNTREAIRRVGEERKAILTSLSEKRSQLLEDMTKGSIGKRDQATKEVERIQKSLSRVNAELESLISPEFHGIDLIGVYGPGTGQSAPKGFRVTADTVAEYQSGNIFRDFNDVSHLTPSQFLKQTNRDWARTISSSGLPFEYMGDHFNPIDTRFFHIVDTEKKMKVLARRSSLEGAEEVRRIKELVAAAESQAGKVMLQSDLAAVVNDASRGVLGNWVNFKTVIDNLIETQRLAGNELQLPFLRAIDREKIIDAAVKTRDFNILAAGETMAREGSATLAKWLAQQHKANPGEAVKLSRYMYETRLQKYDGLFRSILKQNGLTLDDVLTNDDPMTRAVAKRVKEVAELDNLLTETMGGSSLLSEDALRFVNPTEEEFKIAKDFLDDYISNAAEIAEAKSDPLSLARKIMGSPDTYAGEFIGEEELNRRSLAFLRSVGKLDAENPEATQRQILAIAKRIQEQSEYLKDILPNGISSPLMTYSSMDSVGLSMGDLTLATLTERRDREDIKQLNRTRDQLHDKFLYSDQETSEEALRLQQNLEAAQDELRQLIDERYQLSFDSAPTGTYPLPESVVANADKAREQLDARIAAAERSQNYAQRMVDEYQDPLVARMRMIEEEISERESRSVGALLNSSEGMRTGIFKRIEREVADSTSSNLVQMTLKRFNKQEFMAVVNAPETRKFMKGSMIAVGALAVLGAFHGDKQIDRAPEQMGGPPLLPGGSAYEDYSEIDDFSSMYSNARGNSMSPGMLYKVNVNGRIEPTELQSSIQSITGGSMTSTIYQGRETNSTGRSDSRSIITDRFSL